MIFTETQIEKITQGVLHQLRSQGVHVSDGKAGETPLTEKVITEDTLAAAGAAGQTVKIAPGAVITPSGHDYIRRRHVTVEISMAAAAGDSHGTMVATGAPSAAVSAAATAGWHAVTARCEFDAAAAARDYARQSVPQPVVVCSQQPSIVACLLNRDCEVRVAVITESTDSSRLLTDMNPDVVCLNPSGWSFTAMLRLLRQMNVETTPPAGWKELS